MRRAAVLLAIAVSSASALASARTQCGPLDGEQIALLLQPGEEIVATYCARFPASLIRSKGQLEGALVVSTQRLHFIPWRGRDYGASLLRVSWDDVACGWVERYPAFYERLLGIDFEDKPGVTFSIGRTTGSSVPQTLDALGMIDAAVPPNADRAACSRVRSAGDYRPPAEWLCTGGADRQDRALVDPPSA